MTIPLEMVTDSGSDNPSAEATWAEFVARRDAQVARMEMATCNGCDGCGQRCVEGFTVTRAEYKSLREFLKAVPAEEKARIAGQQKTVAWPGAEDSGATVTFCRYRDVEKNNCSVYDARPTICRLFGHTPWLPCPIEAVTQVPEGSPELWNSYRRFERHTWAEWDALLPHG